MHRVRDGDIEIGVQERVGVIGLTRPQAINALSPEMIALALDALTDWAGEDAVAAVLIEGAGEKGFCAGGDVRRVREMALAGKRDDVDAYFADEYEMNKVIATYPKPVVALQHGVVMGGGIGLSSHARYRIATTESRFAMPEAAIGFFCDVGVNALLYKTTEARALAFLMSGETVGAADAIALGLADAAVKPAALPGIRARVIAAGHAPDPDTAIAAIVQGESVDPGPARLCGLADALEGVFALGSVADMVEALLDLAENGDPGAAALHGRLVRHCPTSLAAIVLSHRAARRQRDIARILATDRALALHLALRADFSEGVRAVLIDKDHAPRWRPDRHGDVDVGALAAAIGADYG